MTETIKNLVDYRLEQADESLEVARTFIFRVILFVVTFLIFSKSTIL
jgi:hypothetical protein